MKCLRVERIPTEWWADHKLEGHWRLWLNANGDFTLGTFLQLLDNGGINRVTWLADGTENVFEVK